MSSTITLPQAPCLHSTQLDLLANQGLIIWDDFLPLSNLKVLQHESKTLAHQAAHLHGKVAAQQIRSDTTCWLEPEHQAYHLYLSILNQFAHTFNQIFFTGIQWTEAHYAHYQTGQFYSIHSDNAAGSNVRAISCVFYLNDHWQTHWGGELRIEDLQKQWHTVLPIANRLLIFQSDLLHEVLPITQNNVSRYSITAWMRRDAPIESHY